MRKIKYTTDPKEVYELELKKLQLCFSEIQRVGEGASEPAKINWRMVEYLRHMNFILLEAVQVGELIVQVDS